MKNIIIALVTISVLNYSCTNGQSNLQSHTVSKEIKTNLTPAEFSDKMKELPSAPILDVRTPDEFSGGHIVNAVNYNWKGAEFGKQIAPLDKSKPVFVYCLSGGRSGAAAEKMRSEGFKEVYELEGGMMAWRSQEMPETTSNTISKGMTKQEFEALLNSDKIVLIDFYAEWCAPCQKMKPYLEEISKEMASTVVVVRIDVDANPTLAKELKIDALPVLHVYKNKSIIWSYKRFIGKEEVVKQLK